MKKFDEKFMWSLSSETIRHYTEETLIHKIQENPEQMKILSEIMESVFRQAHNDSERSLTIQADRASDNVVNYLRLKGFSIICRYTGEIRIEW